MQVILYFCVYWVKWVKNVMAIKVKSWPKQPYHFGLEKRGKFNKKNSPLKGGKRGKDGFVGYQTKGIFHIKKIKRIYFVYGQNLTQMFDMFNLRMGL